jgi:hypothetical protein
MINNSGARDLSCTLTSVTPQTPFDCATGCSVSGGASISKTTIAIKNGTKQAWTSNRIPTSSMETLSQPITLIAEVSCVYYENGVASTAIIRTGQISFRVLATSGTANFTVTVNTAGVPTEYCGDLGLPGGGCQSPMENTLNCIRDCVIVPNTAFRTDDLTYTSGSAIAWNGGTCGSALTAYGYTGMSCSTLTDATCPTIPGLVQKITSGIKGVPSWSTTTGCLYQNQSASNKMVVAFKQASTPGPCVSNGQWGLVLYDSADPDAAGVSTQIASWDSAKETTC